jgi:superkiller protein 3
MYDEAVDTYTELVKVNPLDASSYFYLGKVYLYKKKYESAIEAFKKVIQLNPESADAFFMLGVAYYNLKFIDEAKRNLIQADEMGHASASLFLKEKGLNS